MRGKEDQVGVGIIHGGKLCTPLHLPSHLLKHNDHLHLVKYPLKLDTMQLIQAQRGHSVGNRKVGKLQVGQVDPIQEKLHQPDRALLHYNYVYI